MALIWKDRVLETSTTTGTGAFTLAGAVAGFRTFASVCATSDTAYYYIEAVDSSGVPTGDWETGLGTYSAANTLTRTTVLDSSNAGAAVNFAAGTKRVAIAAVAASAGWALAGSWTHSVDVANVDVVNLGGYRDIIAIARGVSASVSGNRCIRVSVNNGSSFYNTVGDYAAIDSNGIEINTSALIFHGSATTAARSIAGVINAIDSIGPKFASGIGDLSGRDKMFVASNNPINALRFENAGGGNLTAGSLWVFGRR